MSYLKSIDQIRSIEWSRSYLWDIRFPDAPSPFNEWFPAVDIEENTSILNSQEFNAGWTTFKIPYNTTLFDFKITFIDDVNHTLKSWLDNWINKEILSEGKGTKPIKEIVKPVEVIKYNINKEVQSMNRYLVYPEGGIYFNGSSEAEVLTYSVTFIITGT